jgi:phenylpropionate dioxygenase-like ring-hydroxylating dioxygenase large terminal subunit
MDARTPAGWFPVARSQDVTARPVAVEAGGRRYVAFRPSPDGPVAVVPERCPHRLVSLAHGTVVDGRLQCPYHGWRFDPSGRCVEIPSSGPDAAVPPRAHLPVPWGVREERGEVWVAPVDPAGEAVPPGDEGPDPGQLLTNADPALAAGWHPLLLADELPSDGGVVTARLLGTSWSVRRSEGGVVVDPVPAATAERLGLVWIAPEPPVAALLEPPEDADPDFVGAWLPPERSGSAAGVLAENFLDVAHFPFVHAGTFGAAEEHYVPPFDVSVEAAGLSSVQEQWFDSPEDPGVAAGLRPLRQRRRATYTYRFPFSLSLRLEELDAGAVKTILFVLQPEDVGATRIYTKMLFSGIGGVPRPGPDVVAAEVAFEQAVLAEDLRLQEAMTVPGLPLRLRDELHVRSDRSGVALRRILRTLTGREGTA